MVTTAQFIEQHMEVFKTMVRGGIIPPNYLQYYKVYLFFLGLKNLKKKTDRYKFTAESMGCSDTTVRNAIAAMKEPIS